MGVRFPSSYFTSPSRVLGHTNFDSDSKPSSTTKWKGLRYRIQKVRGFIFRIVSSVNRSTIQRRLLAPPSDGRFSFPIDQRLIHFFCSLITFVSRLRYRFLSYFFVSVFHCFPFRFYFAFILRLWWWRSFHVLENNCSAILWLILLRLT